SQSSLGSDDQLHEVELSVANKFIEIVTTDATHDFWISPVNLVSIRTNDIGNSPFKPAARYRVFEGHFAKCAAFAGGEDDVHFQNMIVRFPEEKGVAPRRIVPHHPADRCPVGCRRVWTEEKSHRLQVEIELFLNNARFDDSPAFFRIHLDDTVEVL